MYNGLHEFHHNRIYLIWQKNIKQILEEMKMLAIAERKLINLMEDEKLYLRNIASSIDEAAAKRAKIQQIAG